MLKNALSLLYLLNGLTDFTYTCNDISLGHCKELVIFLKPCSYFQGHGRSKMFEKCLVFIICSKGID